MLRVTEQTFEQVGGDQEMKDRLRAGSQSLRAFMG
jgi:hypothetical protein